jgi:hypothetical protein
MDQELEAPIDELEASDEPDEDRTGDARMTTRADAHGCATVSSLTDC